MTLGSLEDVTIRSAVASDAQAISEVFDASVRSGWSYLGDLALEPMFPPSEWDQLIAEHEPPNLLLVAVGGEDSVVGFTAAHPEDGELYLLFVHPGHSGRGIGRALLSAAVDALVAAGCAESYLFTHKENERALAVYAAAGSHADGVGP